MNITFVDDAGCMLMTATRRVFAHFGVPILACTISAVFQLLDRVAAAGHRVLLTGGSGNLSARLGAAIICCTSL